MAFNLKESGKEENVHESYLFDGITPDHSAH
jgi:hypothetical protein